MLADTELENGADLQPLCSASAPHVTLGSSSERQRGWTRQRHVKGATSPLCCSACSALLCAETTLLHCLAIPPNPPADIRKAVVVDPAPVDHKPWRVKGHHLSWVKGAGLVHLPTETRVDKRPRMLFVASILSRLSLCRRWPPTQRRTWRSPIPRPRRAATAATAWRWRHYTPPIIYLDSALLQRAIGALLRYISASDDSHGL